MDDLLGLPTAQRDNAAVGSLQFGCYIVLVWEDNVDTNLPRWLVLQLHCCVLRSWRGSKHQLSHSLAIPRVCPQNSFTIHFFRLRGWRESRNGAVNIEPSQASPVGREV